MNRLILITIFALSTILSEGQPVKIIFNNDMESDMDDVGALAMLHGFADAGEAEILGTISSSLNPWAAPVIDVINTFFGRPDLPIGNVKTKRVYRNSSYAKMIAEMYLQDIGLGERAPDTNRIYKEILSSQPDTSVVIVTVGYLTNLSHLIQSQPDQYSALNGMELLKRKVKRLVCMGGRYPLQLDPAKWGNFKPDPEAIFQMPFILARYCSRTKQKRGIRLPKHTGSFSGDGTGTITTVLT